MLRKLKKIFITGLTATIPLVITGYVIIGLFHFADGILGQWINRFFYKYIGYEIPGLGILIALLVIFILGSLIHLSRIRFFRWTQTLFMGFLFRMPLINRIFPPVKRIVDFLFFPPKKNFKSAVLVEYPRKGIYSLGFITSESPFKIEEKIGKKLYNIFISSSPSPLTGFTIIVPEEDVIFLNIGIDDALKLVISGGLLNPGQMMRKDSNE